jgi:hypothetical protein
MVHGEEQNGSSPYSLELAPCSLFLFVNIKLKYKGKGLNTILDIQHSLDRGIMGGRFQNWLQCWQDHGAL